jgi:hypothetical protein
MNSVTFRWAILLAAIGSLWTRASAGDTFALRDGDVVAFVGGESIAIQGETGHLESLLAAAHPGTKVRFRNLGWEGDTVFEQPRDVNFPGLAEQLKRVGATVVLAEFGRAESMAGADRLPAFVAAYEKLCDAMAKQTPRVVLVTPAPFEKPLSEWMPDLSRHNDSLKVYAKAVADLAKRRGFACVDLFGELSAQKSRFTAPDGLHPTPQGAGVIAGAYVRQLGLTNRGGEPDAAGRWPQANVEALRQAVVVKNRLWFDYWRPMNWAFLGGDRMFVPSSRDPKNLEVRIFPREIEKFVPLIEREDARVDNLAKAAAGGGK